MFREIFLGDNNILNRKTILLHVSLILISFVFILIFSNSTSFLYPFFGGDSAVFQTIGKYWREGFLPYKALFDHKGPLLFLINAIGYAIYPRSGIMIPQIIFMYISILLIWRMFELYFDSMWQKIFFFALTMIYLTRYYFGGNTVSEYSVIFISASAYCFMLSLKFSKHKLIYSFIYGFGFGACVLLRTSDALPICCFAILSAIFLIRDRKYKDLWNNILIFFAGFFTIVLPFMIYFAANDALYDAIYGTIIFNTKYATHRSFSDDDAIVFMISVAVHFFPFLLMIIASAVNIFHDRKDRISWCGLFSGIMILVGLIKLKPYDYYYLILVPMFPLLFVVLRNTIQFLQPILKIQGFSLKRLIYRSCLLLSLAYCCLCLKICWDDIPTTSEESIYIEQSLNIKNLAKIIPESERSSFLTWGMNEPMTRFILETDLHPCRRFYFNQSLFSFLDPEVKQECLGGLTVNSPLWILYGGRWQLRFFNNFSPFEDTEIEKILEEKYVLKGETNIGTGNLKLYRLNK